MGEEILPMLDTSSLDILMKESLVKRQNNEYQGALRWPLKLNLQQDLILGENPLGKCLKCLVLYIPIMLPATNAIKNVSRSFNKIWKKNIKNTKIVLLWTNKTHSQAIMLELCLYPSLKEMMNSWSVNFLQACHLHLDTLLEKIEFVGMSCDST